MHEHYGALRSHEIVRNEKKIDVLVLFTFFENGKMGTFSVQLNENEKIRFETKMQI